MGKLLQFVPVLLQVLSSVFVHHPGAPEDKKAAAVVVGKSLLGTVVDDVAAYEPAVLGLVAAVEAFVKASGGLPAGMQVTVSDPRPRVQE